MTIFGVRWEGLGLADLERFLADAEPEPLLWEAKGIEAKAGEVRRQVCGFANSHDGGYLILGAAQGDGGSWTLDGVEFNDEPPTWVANVIGNGGVNPYPDGLDTKSFATGDGKYVAVVRVPASPTPPCNAHGAVYERVSGRTISVREPIRLAQLFARGDQARTDAESNASAAARGIMFAGFALRRHRPTRPQFGLGLAGAGYLSDVGTRIFSREFEERVLASIGALDHGPELAGMPGINTDVDQDSRRFESEGRENLLGWSWVVAARRNGAVAIYWVPGVDQGSIDKMIDEPVRAAWTAAEEILGVLGPQGPRYLHLVVGGGENFPPQGSGGGLSLSGPNAPTFVGRGPLPPGVDETVLRSIGRELRRAAGQMTYEEAQGGE